MDRDPPPRPDLPGPPPARWRGVEAIPVFVIALLAGAVLSVPIIAITGTCSIRFILGTLAGEVGFLGTVLVWVRFVDHAPVAALGFPQEPLRDALFGLAVGIGLVVAGSVTLALVNAVASAVLGHSPPQPQQVVSCVRGSGLLFLAPVVILAAPLGEETFFRGFLFQGLRRSFGFWPAAVVSAAAFAAVHFAGPSFLILLPAEFVVGLGLAFVYGWRRSLLASMAAHATFNLVGYLFIVRGRA